VATDLDEALACLQRAARRMVSAGNSGRLIAVTSDHGISRASDRPPTTRLSTVSAA
jgi:hypothetical protein